MKPELIMQSEISQKEKDKYCIYIYIYREREREREFRKTVLTILHAGWQRRHRRKEQTFGLSGRRPRLDDLRE